jgi:hypothetical protein
VAAADKDKNKAFSDTNRLGQLVVQVQLLFH